MTFVRSEVCVSKQIWHLPKHTANTYLNAPDQQIAKTSAFIKVILLSNHQIISTFVAKTRLLLVLLTPVEAVRGALTSLTGLRRAAWKLFFSQLYIFNIKSSVVSQIVHFCTNTCLFECIGRVTFKSLGTCIPPDILQWCAHYSQKLTEQYYMFATFCGGIHSRKDGFSASSRRMVMPITG